MLTNRCIKAMAMALFQLARISLLFFISPRIHRWRWLEMLLWLHLQLWKPNLREISCHAFQKPQKYIWYRHIFLTKRDLFNFKGSKWEIYRNHCKLFWWIITVLSWFGKTHLIGWLDASRHNTLQTQGKNVLPRRVWRVIKRKTNSMLRDVTGLKDPDRVKRRPLMTDSHTFFRVPLSQDVLSSTSRWGHLKRVKCKHKQKS